MKTIRDQFLLRSNIAYLNFGSFGACPKPAFEDYQKWQHELEEEPVQFIMVNGPEYLRQSRIALAAYINCRPDDLVFVPNPSYAINIVAKSLKLHTGDEILSTNLEYGAMDRTWNYYCNKSGARFVRQPIDLPLVSKDEFIEQFFRGLSSKTRAVFLSQITSSTALIFPVKEICNIAREKGLLTIVDGAHVPGHIPLDIQKLNVDVYTGACHKWMMSPKGCSFLYVKKEHQSMFDPLVVSWGYESATPSHSQFLDYHEMQGTRDFSAFLTVPASISFMEQYNWPEVAARCRKLVKDNARRFCDLLETTTLSPLTDEFVGQMLSLPIPCPEPEKLQRLLFEEYKIEIPLMRHGEQVFIRYSIQAFNTPEDMDRLYSALKEIKSSRKLIF